MIGIWFPISQGRYALVDRDLYDEVTEYNKTIEEAMRYL